MKKYLLVLMLVAFMAVPFLVDAQSSPDRPRGSSFSFDSSWMTTDQLRTLLSQLQTLLAERLGQITEPTLTVTAPIAQTYHPGDAVTITWASTNISKVLITWQKLDDKVTVIPGQEGLVTAVAIPSTGNASWTIPVGFTAGSYQVKVFNYNSTAGGNGATSPYSSSQIFAIASVDAPVVGTCGSAANGQSFANAPTANLCNAGNATAVASLNSTWTWRCQGSTDSVTASCSAPVDSGAISATRPTAEMLAFLQDCVGFGCKATGGKDGLIYHVTNLKDDGKPGNLRAALESKDPLWIVFDVSGVIKLNSRIMVKSNKTIDGRGKDITITNWGLLLHTDDTKSATTAYANPISNVIIENIKFMDIQNDAMTIKYKAKNIWVDHCTFSDDLNGKKSFSGDTYDGQLDITRASTDITVSWTIFKNHKKVMLIGHADNFAEKDWDKDIRVTLHHNYFKDFTIRAPMMRFGYVHSFNNYLANWGDFGAASITSARLYVENNIFEGNKNAVTLSTGAGHPKGYVRASNNLLLSKAAIAINSPDKVANPPYQYTPEVANTALKAEIVAGAGWRQDSSGTAPVQETKTYPADVQGALNTAPNPQKSIVTWDKDEDEIGAFNTMRRDVNNLRILKEYLSSNNSDNEVLGQAKKIILAYVNKVVPTNNAVDNREFAKFTEYYGVLRNSFSTSEKTKIDNFLLGLARNVVTNKQFHLAEAEKGNSNVMARFDDVVGSIALVLDDSTLRNLVLQDTKYSLKKTLTRALDEDVKGDFVGSNPNCRKCVEENSNCTTDFCRRDSLGYNQRPVTHGSHLIYMGSYYSGYNWTEEKNLIKGIIDFTLPYINGEKNHLEFKYSSAGKDKEKALYNKPYVYDQQDLKEIGRVFPGYNF